MTADYDPADLFTKLQSARTSARAWEQLYNERNRLWRAAEDKLDAVRALLSQNGCDCECECDAGGHEVDCDPCLACRIGAKVRL